MFEQITNENVMMFALKHDNPQYEGEKEFQDDMKRFKYIKRYSENILNMAFSKKVITKSHNRVKQCVWCRSCSTLLLFKIEPTYWTS